METNLKTISISFSNLFKHMSYLILKNSIAQKAVKYFFFCFWVRKQVSTPEKKEEMTSLIECKSLEQNQLTTFTYFAMFIFSPGQTILFTKFVPNNFSQTTAK